MLSEGGGQQRWMEIQSFILLSSPMLKTTNKKLQYFAAFVHVFNSNVNTGTSPTLLLYTSPALTGWLKWDCVWQSWSSRRRERRASRVSEAWTHSEGANKVLHIGRGHAASLSCRLTSSQHLVDRYALYLLHCLYNYQCNRLKYKLIIRLMTILWSHPF